MVYYFNFKTGKIVDKSESIKHNIIDTKDGWTPYYNLNKKYVGLKSENKFFDIHLIYYNPELDCWVRTYEELDWSIKTLDKILNITKERARTITSIELLKFKTEDNVFKAIENIKNNDEYKNCEEKMLAVYSVSIAKLFKVLEEDG